MKISTLWLKDYVKIKGSLEEAAERLTMSGLEVKAITPAREGLVFETEITSNRPDWLSYIGVAREISALYSTAIKMPKVIAPKKPSAFPQDFAVDIKDADLCPFYTGTILKGIKPCATPDCIRDRLEMCGLRSIDFLVDVTNFVLLECGQPLHAFDLGLLEGDKIIIRRAKDKESIAAIDGKTYELGSKDLVIADAVKPVAIAGVMGGKGSEVSSQTRDILLESAYFQPASVRQTSKRLGISTDSSYRFERGVDPEGVLWARDRVISLILEHTEVAEITRVKSAGRKPARRRTVLLPFEKMDALLGTKIPPAKVENIFKSLGLKVLQKNKKLIRVLVPTFRSDLTGPVDLVEEAARIYGYQRIPETLPTLVTLPDTLQSKLKFEVVRDTADELAGAGFLEAQNFSIIRGDVYESYFEDKAKLVKIHNPQNKELELMRPTLIPGLIETAQRNQYRGNKYFRLFEIGQVYSAKGKELPDEAVSLGMICYGSPEKTWDAQPRKVNIFDVKGGLEYLLDRLGIREYEWSPSESIWTEAGTALALSVKRKQLGTIGEIKQEILKKFDMEGPVVTAEVDLEDLMHLVSKEKKYVPISRFPSVSRDLSLLVPKELAVDSVRGTILEEGNELLRKVNLFDVYEGKNIPSGVKSLAFNLEYQSHDRTLASEEVQEEHIRIAKVLQEKYNAQLPPAK